LRLSGTQGHSAAGRIMSMKNSSDSHVTGGKSTYYEVAEMGCGGMDWIELAQDRHRCRALANAVMNILIP